MKKYLYIIVFIIFFSVINALTPRESAKHIGETAVVCGTVVAAEYKPEVKGSPTFLDFEEEYPGNIFTVVIWGFDRKKFDYKPEVYFLNKEVCFLGVLK